MTIYQKYICCLSLLLLTVSSILPASLAHASSTKLYLDAPTSVKVGDNFTVRVLANSPSSNGNRSRIDLAYPSEFIQAVSSNTESSVFGGNTFINNNFSSTHGRITHLAYPIPAPQGQGMVVFSVSFSTRKTGTVNFTFDANSVINDSIPEKPTVSMAIVPKSCPVGQTGTPPNCSKPANNQASPSNPSPAPQPGPSSKPQPSKPNSSKPIVTTRQQPAQIYPGRIAHPALPSSPLPAQTPALPSNPQVATPDIVNQQVLDSELDIVNLRTATRIDRADLIWELNHPSNTTFRYGKSADNLKESPEVKRESETKFYVDIRGLDPGETYYYTINGERTTGSETMSQSGTFSTKGFGVKIKTLQQDGSPLTNAQISFEDTGGSISTNEEGIAYIQVKDGNYNLNVTKGGHSSTHSIVVNKKSISDDGTAEIQNIELKTSATSASVSEEPSRKAPSAVAYIVTIMIGIIIMTIAGFIFYFRKRAKENRGNTNQSVVVIEDDWSPPQG